MVRSWWLALRQLAARHVLVVDGLTAVVIGVGVAVGSADAGTDAGPHVLQPDLVGFALVGLSAAGLVVRRRLPLVGFAVSYGGMLLFLVLRYPYGPIVQMAAFSVYSVAAWRPVRTSAAVCALALLVYLPIGVLLLGTVADLDDVAVTLAWAVLPWLAGTAVRSWRRARAQAAAAERRQHRYEERLRIAKEVHDVVGHGLTVISMQAGMALHVLDGDAPEEVASALRAIRTTSKDAMEELRATLAAFPAGNGPDERRSAPGLERLPALVNAVSSDRLSGDLAVGGQRGRVPVSVDLAGYRIVQESLTNVVRHAAASRVRVCVAYEPAAVRLTITDDGRGSGGGPAGPAGHGLDGMRERARALGGTLEAGPRGGGGFRVHAMLPYPKAQA
jgi:signal transduction histidine kinase